MAAKKINLLPVEFTRSKDFTRSVQVLRTVATMMTAVFVVVAVIAGAIFIFLSNQIRILNNQKISLRKNISDLEKTEQQLVLVRNRTQRIGNLLGEREIEGYLDKHLLILDDLNSEISFDGAEFGSDVSSLELKTGKSKLLSNLKDVIYEKKDQINSLLIDEIDFDIKAGYKIIMSIF